jgi:hypothetical protein
MDGQRKRAFVTAVATAAARFGSNRVDSGDLCMPRLSAQSIVSYASAPIIGRGCRWQRGDAGGTHRFAAKSYPQR